MMETLNVQQAADLLHLNIKRVQGLARAGKLPGVRVGRKWLFRRDEIETLLGGSTPLRRSVPLTLSARNHLRGAIAGIRSDGLMAEIQIRIGDQDLVAVITRASVDRMGLAVGDEVFAVIKSTEIMVGKERA
jgi:molybdate transport system regulatory protein